MWENLKKEIFLSTKCHYISSPSWIINPIVHCERFDHSQGALQMAPFYRHDLKYGGRGEEMLFCSKDAIRSRRYLKLAGTLRSS